MVLRHIINFGFSDTTFRMNGINRMTRESRDALVAQWLERRTFNPRVVGSNPTKGHVHMCEIQKEDTLVRHPCFEFILSSVLCSLLF